MKVVKLRYPNIKEHVVNEDIVLALGYFDGVHRGHQAVIKKAKDIAEEKGLKLAVMSFNHHPSIVFSKMPVRHFLTSVEEKASLFEQLGVDIFYVVEFTSLFASVTVEQFENEFLMDLNVKVVVAGFDYHYGKMAKGNLYDLKDKNMPYDVHIVEKLEEDGEKISSTFIRQQLDEGNVDKVTQALDRAYEMSGIVVRGHARGRTLGFPTANISLNAPYYLIKIGVYAVKIKVGDVIYNGMASIGRNVTFADNNPITIEVNIFDFDEQIYGETVTVYWHAYLRDEIKFNTVEDLVEQLKEDEQHSRRLLSC